ncbi:MAG: hypothetical protein KJ597_01725 [Nanoarchaeota archaeon]|nr:hypothetical protein [Nanoarchaeota archaeon]MBU1622270.1 hypothetical protein [Nanoarchaeota archaeon]
MRYKRPDRKNALSILAATEREMKFTLSIKPSEESGSTIVRNIYECFRMLGDALLVAKGVKSEDHIAPIRELTKVKVETERPIYVIDNLRRLRHNVNYYGYRPKLEEVKEVMVIAKSNFQPILKAVKELVAEVGLKKR